MKTLPLILAFIAFVQPVFAQCPENINVNKLAKERKIEDLLEGIRAIEQFRNCKDSLALLYHNLGIAYRHEDPKLAISYTKKAIQLRADLLPDALFDFAKSNFNIGAFYKENGDYENAAAHFKIAKDAYEKINSDRVIRSSREYAGIMREKGEYKNAVQYLEFAIKKAKVFKKNMELAKCLNDLGYVYNDSGEFENAILYLQQAVNIYNQLVEDKITKNNKVASLINLSYSYFKIDNCQLSIKNAKRAREISIEVNNKDYQAKALNNLGICYKKLGSYKEARAAFEQSLQIRKELNDNYATAECYNNLGDIYILEAKTETALRSYYASVELVVEDAPELYDVFNIKKASLMNASNKTQLLGYFSDLASGWKSYYDQDPAEEHLQYALKAYLKADQLIDLMRQEHSVLESKLFWRNQTRSIYEAALEVCYLLQDEVQAFYFLEKSKAVLLLDALLENNAKGVIPKTLVEQEKQLQEKLNKIKYDLEQAIWSESEEELALRESLIETQEALDEFAAMLERDYPQYYAIKYQNQVISLEAAKMSLIPKKGALVSYFYGDNYLYLLKARSIGKSQLIQLKRTTQFDENISNYLGLFASSTKRRNPEIEQYKVYGTTLFEQLYAPVFEQNEEEVLILPDGQLAFIPFDALLTSKEGLDFNTLDYLIRSQLIRYAYSASVLEQQLRMKSRGREISYFAPGFENKQRGLTPLIKKASPNLERLGRFIAFENEEATINNFNAVLSNSQIISLFTHASTGSDKQVPKIEFIDTSLYLSQLYILQIPAEMVVLSACETGIGKDAKGEGVMSLARGFAHAGAASLVASLWNINDQSTSDLLNVFYKELKAGQGKSTALHEAKLAYLAQEDQIVLPANWATFVFIGNPDPVNLGTNDWWKFLLLGGVFFIGMIIYQRNKAA